ncbi:MAG: histidine--tRNA ligase [Candidatus Moranbacteria bacterium]|nr:histidine--tRNA ligase [Candidatus Moranbacteria bacterium]
MPRKNVKVEASQKSASKEALPKKKLKNPIVLQNPRGMKDILPGDQGYWTQVRRVLESSYQKYGFQRIDIPVLEYANLFSRSIGEDTDIMDKEVYSFKTKGGDEVALRPEFTAGIARSYIQHGMNVLPKPVKLFSIGQAYRYDRPQEGRYREFWQANFDIFGEEDSILDAEVMQLAYRVLGNLKLKDIQFQVNSIGCTDCRKSYLSLLVSYFKSKNKKLCKDCKRRLGTNPLRILDCKEDKCIQVSSGAPQTVDHLCEDCHEHFKSLLEYLDELEIPYSINPSLVRGLDYYSRTVFEIWSLAEGKRLSLGGGGRYDKLIENLGGEPTPSIGFGLGLDRIVMEMKRTNAKQYEAPKPRIFLAQLGKLAKRKSLKLFADLEKNGILVAESFGRGGLKSQLRTANKLGVDITLIVGQKEALDETVIVKNMVSGTQETVAKEKLLPLIKKIMKSKLVVLKYNNK